MNVLERLPDSSRVAIVRLRSLGDCVLTTPAIEILKRDLELATPSQYLDAYPIQQRAVPAASSWGKNGYNEHWVNPKTEWMWRPLHDAADRMRRAVQGRGRHARAFRVLEGACP